MSARWSLSGDLDETYVAIAAILALISVVLLGWELYRKRQRRGAALTAFTGVMGALLLLLAVLRPVTIATRDSLMGPRVLILVDVSRSMDLPGVGGLRREAAHRALGLLSKKSSDVRESVLGFGEGQLVPLTFDAEADSIEYAPVSQSDLDSALTRIAESRDERPGAIVVISDGRFGRPPEAGTAEAVRLSLGGLKVPVHTVGVATDVLSDAAIRRVEVAGASVAHQPVQIRVEVACTGALQCDDIPVKATELRERGEPTVLATGVAKVVDGTAVVELSVTLHRAGQRIVEIEIDAPKGQEITENDRRYLTLSVARDRVRVLHVAGRPTYDVRGLRMWLKSDAAVDLVAFFILRTPEDDVGAPPDELALIPFPVDELFQEHLASFDAVVLQDIDAQIYGLAPHLRRLRDYVQKGGGLIMVGGPNAFGPGRYADSPLEDALPVELPRELQENGTDLASFRPVVTEAGKVAPVLGPLRDLIGEQWPEMPGTNLVGRARSGSTVLLQHPTQVTADQSPMPVLALGEFGSGRSIALTIDSTHQLMFSTFAADAAAGRAHGALWDALLGWLMRDPRFEPAVIDIQGSCIAGVPVVLKVRPPPGTEGTATVTVRRLGSEDVAFTGTRELVEDRTGTQFDLGALKEGGYSATVEIGSGAVRAPTTRQDFACESGGPEWADIRPAVDRLRAIAEATGGQAVMADDAASLLLPEAERIAAERKVSALVPPWVWTLLAAAFLGGHWIVRRRSGLS